MEDNPQSSKIADAASDLLERLDDLYDQRSDAMAKLIAAIESHLPLLSPSPLGQVASAAHSELIALDSSQLEPSKLNRRALEITDDLRLLCAYL